MRKPSTAVLPMAFEVGRTGTTALVNKACDFLKEYHMVPPLWRQDENKGMTRAHDGRWVQRNRQEVIDDDTHHHHLHRMGLHPDDSASLSASSMENNAAIVFGRIF
ncbi:unnamed protein product, partial [Musa acuminata subsp. burmannicoides]